MWIDKDSGYLNVKIYKTEPISNLPMSYIFSMGLNPEFIPESLEKAYPEGFYLDDYLRRLEEEYPIECIKIIPEHKILTMIINRSKKAGNWQPLIINPSYFERPHQFLKPLELASPPSDSLLKQIFCLRKKRFVFPGEYNELVLEYPTPELAEYLT